MISLVGSGIGIVGGFVMSRFISSLNIGGGEPIIPVVSPDIIALAIGVATLAFGPVGPLGGLLIGLTIGVVFTAAGSLSHRLFGLQGFKVWLIEVGSDVLNYALAGLIIGLFG